MNREKHSREQWTAKNTLKNVEQWWTIQNFKNREEQSKERWTVRNILKQGIEQYQDKHSNKKFGIASSSNENIHEM